MNYGIILAIIFTACGLSLYFKALEQYDKITNPKTIRRMAIVFFIAGIVSALLGADTK